MDRKTVPARVYDKKSFFKDYYYPVPERLDNIQLFALPWDQIESTYVSALMDSSHHKSLTVTHLSIPSTSSRHQDFPLKYDSQPYGNGPTSKRKSCESDENEVDDYDHVLVIDEDREDEEESLQPETGFVSPNQRQQVITQDISNGASQLILIDSIQLQSLSTVTHLSMPSTSSHQQDIISNYDSQQPTVSGPNSRPENEDNDDDDSVQWLDDGQENEDSSPSVKKPKLDTTRADDAQSKVDRRQSVKGLTIKSKICESEDKVEDDDDDDSVQWLDDRQEITSFPACTFTDECKEIVYSHYPRKHKTTDKPVLACRAKPGCTYRTTDSSHRHIHERVHLGIKPYLCGWRYCQFSSAYRASTVVHIKRTHFGSSGVMARVAAKPVDYLLVDRSLLLKHRLIARTFQQ